MPLSYRTNTPYRLLIASSFAGAMLLVAGCTSTAMPPTAALAEAKLAIETAEKDDASRFAAGEMDQSRQKLVQADRAVVLEDMELAKRLAQESTVTAQLAGARTELAKAVAVNDELSQGTKALMEEMARNGESN